jgi:hypothetical protein
MTTAVEPSRGLPRLPALRRELLRRQEAELRLPPRTVYLDHSTLPVGSISTFL